MSKFIIIEIVEESPTVAVVLFLFCVFLFFTLAPSRKTADETLAPAPAAAPAPVQPARIDATQLANQQAQRNENARRHVDQQFLGLWENPLKRWGSSWVSRISIVRTGDKLVAVEWAQLCQTAPEPGTTECTTPVEGPPLEYQLVGQNNDSQLLFQRVTPGYGTTKLSLEPAGSNLQFSELVNFEDPNRPPWAHSGLLERR